MSEKTRAQLIYEYWRDQDPPVSYSFVGGKFDVTRNVVAGAVGRYRKPEDGRPSTDMPPRWVGRTRK